MPEAAMPWGPLADIVLVVHLGVVLFVVGGLVAVGAGMRWHWRWVRGRRFRFAHLAAVGTVVAQAWLGQQCPLTVLESWLRVRAGGMGYGTSFVQHGVQRLLFYPAPDWVFVVAYTVFGGLVLLAWRLCPPGSGHQQGRVKNRS